MGNKVVLLEGGDLLVFLGELGESMSEFLFGEEKVMGVGLLGLKIL